MYDCRRIDLIVRGDVVDFPERHKLTLPDAATKVFSQVEVYPPLRESGAARENTTGGTVTMDERMNEMRVLRTAEDPCQRTDAHMAHRNWISDEVGVCPGVATNPEES